MPLEKDIPEDEEIEEELPAVPDLPVPPDGGWGWMIVLASFFTNLLVDGVCYSFGVLYLSLLAEFGESKAKTAWVGSLLPGCYLIIGPVTSALVNKFGSRKISIVGSMMAATFFVISGFAPSIDVLIFTYGIMGGIGFGLMYLPAIVIVAQYFSTKRSMATGLAVCGSGIGTFIFGPLTTILINEFGWRGSLIIIGAMVLNGMVCGALYRPLTAAPVKKKKKKREETSDPVEAKRGIIMQRLIDQKKRDRTISTKSLDGAVITTDNKIVRGSDTKNVIMVTELPAIPNGNVTSQTGSTPDLSASGVIYDAVSNLKSHESISTSQPHLSSDKIGQNNNKSLINKQLDKIKYGGSLSKFRKRAGSLGGEGAPLFDSSSVKSRASPEEIRKREAARPLYRQDVFYTGSVQSLAEYKKDPNTYLASVVSIPEPPLDDDSCEAKCLPFKRVLTQMFDFSMLRSVTFLIVAASGILSFTGFFTPFIYTTEYAVACGVPLTQAAFLISIIGICNTLGRVVAGFLADRPWADSLMIHNVSIIIAGVATCLEPLCTTFVTLCIFCVIFGTCVAAFIALRSIVLCELLGVEKLNNAFGLLILFQGIAALIGTPISGAIVDRTGSHTISFIVAGVLVFVSGIMCFPLRRVSNWEKLRDERRKGVYNTVPPVPEISMEDINA